MKLQTTHYKLPTNTSFAVVIARSGATRQSKERFPRSVFDLARNDRSAKLVTNCGFTLIELLLYVSIVGTVIFSIAGFLSLSMQSRVKNQTIAEVEQQGVQVMQVITQTGRNATDINFTSAFDLSGGVIRQNAIALANSRVAASNLTFQNLSRAGTPGTIRIQFTLTHVNPEGRNEYDYTKTFYGSASLR